MVSLWPWRGDDTSPASFEKALSSLSAKISKSQLQLDTLRQRSRRLRVLWTLYTSFAYLLCVIIMALVVGWKNWGSWEYSAMAGSPVVIYLIREAISTYYTYRINVVSRRLEEQQTERAKTIEKLKAATKYNSTQQLLEKYGGVIPQPSPKSKGKSPARTPRSNQKQPPRTSIGPPPTANIPRNDSLPSTPQHQRSEVLFEQQSGSVSNTPVRTTQPSPPEFAPNAFPAVPQYDHGAQSGEGGQWYDRFLDILLGEDETAPKNRLVLICKYCRLVNGQAPPGVKRLEDLGEWKCMACGGKNGVADEGQKMVEEMKDLVKAESQHKDEIVALLKEGAETTALDDKEIEDEGLEPEVAAELEDENEAEIELLTNIRKREPKSSSSLSK